MPGSAVDLPAAVDVVVIGAGHNGLTAAAYLAGAGLEVLVLEANEIPGGNTRTEALTLPGFAHDSCSSAHVLIQSNPMLRDDELGLLAKHGLEYVHTDPAVVLPQADGDALVMHRDLEATASEVARWSPRDADAFRAMIGEWTGGLAAVHGRWSSGLELGDSEAARAYRLLRDRSAWDVIHERFEHPTIRSFVMWLAMATIQDPRRPGTGVLPSSLTAGRLSFGWSTPVGGSAALPNALISHLEEHGGQVVCSAPVAAIDVSGGTTQGVRTTDGRRVRARKAVVSSANLATVAGMLEGVDPPADLVEARDSWQPGLSVFAVHAALRGDLGFHTNAGPVHATAGGFGSTEGVAAQIDALHAGVPDATDPWLLVVNQTVVDDSRAPKGHGTFKILTIAPYERSDGRTWQGSKDEYAAQLVDLVRKRTDGLEADDVLAIRAESPVDVAGHNPHNLGGSCHGGEFRTPSGGVIPGWPSYLTGVPGLFLTGATSHPGGSVSGRPGRNAARAVLQELGLDPGAVMGPG
ncbi:MAG: dependent oxidoreductase [Marmoricola sp.]|nr:dependent oxidoreductase [Marmoricola sp.]